MTHTLNELLNLSLTQNVLYRYFAQVGIVWRRAAPTVKQPDPEYDEKMAKVTEAKANISEKHPVFYEDEVDIDLNPKIGADLCFKGQQNGLSPRGKIENITLRVASMPKQSKSPMLKESKRTLIYLSKC